MKYVTVIGNGESRKSFDLYQLEWLGNTIGTNAVHRDFHPDQLVCCDRRMVQEAGTRRHLDDKAGATSLRRDLSMCVRKR